MKSPSEAEPPGHLEYDAMKTIQTLCAAAATLLVALCLGGCGQDGSSPGGGANPAPKDSGVAADLEYEVGYPTAKTTQALFDKMDLQRATQAYLWAFPAVSAASVRRGVYVDLGAGRNDIIIYEKFLDTKSTWFTGNTTTIYAVGIIDLAVDGPIVVEVPAGPTAGMLADFWFRTSGIGRLGPDKGNGGKFLLVPPGYDGDVPSEGYFIVNSKMNDNNFFIRGIVQDGDVPGASALIERSRIYPYSQRANPKPNRFLKVTGKPINTVEPDGLAYWRLLADVVANNPVEERDRFLMAMIKPLGIEKGKPFRPDARQTRILEEGARLGHAMAQAASFDTRLESAAAYPGKNWMHPMVLNTTEGTQQEAEHYSQLDERLHYLYLATWPAQAMNLPHPSPGQRYLQSFKDADGNWLCGDKNYRLHVPANVPAKQFWSISVYGRWCMNPTTLPLDSR